MPQPYDKPQRECARCTGNTFPNGCANYCYNFTYIDVEVDDFIFDEPDLEPSESRGESICDNCLTSSGHCPGQLDCDKWHSWIGKGKPIDESDMEPRTIGFHLLDSDNN